jgi:formylglycine-generating enzyme required for sulfatase activity
MKAQSFVVLCAAVLTCVGAQSAEPEKQMALDLGGGVKLELVLINAGKFMMGGDKNYDEKPVHEVTISQPFYMGTYLVTQEQYEKVMAATPSFNKAQPKNPVEQVSWFQANEFCKKLSASSGKTVRLPTEAEFEYALRAGTTTEFFFGDDIAALPDYAWFVGNSDKSTHPVGQKKPNPWGLYDMLGNVWQWCSDAAADDKKVVRGCAWNTRAEDARLTVRGSYPPEGKSWSIGVRVARTLGK